MSTVYQQLISTKNEVICSLLFLWDSVDFDTWHSKITYASNIGIILKSHIEKIKTIATWPVPA